MLSGNSFKLFTFILKLLLFHRSHSSHSSSICFNPVDHSFDKIDTVFRKNYKNYGTINFRSQFISLFSIFSGQFCKCFSVLEKSVDDCPLFIDLKTSTIRPNNLVNLLFHHKSRHSSCMRAPIDRANFQRVVIITGFKVPSSTNPIPNTNSIPIPNSI